MKKINSDFFDVTYLRALINLLGKILCMALKYNSIGYKTKQMELIVSKGAV